VAWHAQAPLVVCFIRSAIGKWNAVVNDVPDAHHTLRAAELAQAVVTGLDGIAILHACTATLAFNRSRRQRTGSVPAGGGDLWL
jgi:hypothetical protein